MSWLSKRNIHFIITCLVVVFLIFGVLLFLFFNRETQGNNIEKIDYYQGNLHVTYTDDKEISQIMSYINDLDTKEVKADSVDDPGEYNGGVRTYVVTLDDGSTEEYMLGGNVLKITKENKVYYYSISNQTEVGN